MPDTNPKMDFRYSLGDSEIEGFQITPANRHQQEQWPPWLNMQKLPDEMNALYSMGDGTDNLVLNLPGGEVVLPPLAWVVKYSGGSLGIIEALEMENYTKVVPVPPPVVHPAADGIPDVAAVTVLKPVLTEESLKNISGDVTELRNEMLSAIKMLQEDGDSLAALEYLKKCMAARTIWCRCAPGQCASEAENGADIDIASCRQNSPLVKA